MKKTVIAIVMTALMVTSVLIPLLSVQAATTPTSNGLTVDGILKTDTYVLYPYTKENLYLGISKYGELINGEASPKLGLKYGTMEVFANPHVAESDWSQGWFIDIHYADLENRYQNVWAFAMYSDVSGASGIGGNWQEACPGEPGDAPHGGRKTNAWATTDPIQVLYDGPRELIVMTNTTIYQRATKTSDDALVGVVLTFVFDKVKKDVVVYKDIKRLDLGKFSRTFEVEFSNRGEWDIGTTSAPPSYAYFYDNLKTAYDGWYHDFYNTGPDGCAKDLGFDVAQMISKNGQYVGFAAFWPPLFSKLVDGTTHITRDTILNSISTKVFNETWGIYGETQTGLIKDSTHTFWFEPNGWPIADWYPIGAGEFTDEPMVFKNGILQSGDGVDYWWYHYPDGIEFRIAPNPTDYITVVYKHKLPECVDLVGTVASETLDGCCKPAGPDNMQNHVAEPKTPYVIGEWAFDLKDEDQCRQFRAVTVYGLTDRHDADDQDVTLADTTYDPVTNPNGLGSDCNIIDSEVQYMLNETFNPADIYSAVEKQDYSWFYTSAPDTTTKTIQLTAGLNDPLYYQLLGVSPPMWTGYNITEYNKANTSKTVESMWVNKYENGKWVAHSGNWALLLNSSYNNQGANDGNETLWITPIANASCGCDPGPLTMKLKDLVDFDFYYKMVCGQNTPYGPHIEILLSECRDGYNGTVASGDYTKLTADRHNPNTSTWWQHYTLNNIDDFVPAHDGADESFKIAEGTYLPVPVNQEHSYEYFTDNEILGNMYVQAIGISVMNGSAAYVDDLSVGYLDRPSGIHYERVYNMEEDKLIPSDWNAYCSMAERVTIGTTLIPRIGYNTTSVAYSVNFLTGKITLYNPPTGVRHVVYNTIEENMRGRYEWATVGRDAQTIDSAGLALVTAAFKNKDIEIGLTGADMKYVTIANMMPYVMSKIGAANTVNDYYYTDGTYRTALGGDWCTTYPIARSDMIGVGGPYANMLAYYMNDFASAMYGLPDFAMNSPYENMIAGVSCWNRGWNGTWNVYSSDEETGYAVISTYKDLNGTVMFQIWGYWGRDTYYATQWFHEDGKIQLQCTPRGINSVILQITYGDDPIHPTFHIVECLGTISERLWVHNGEYKGGIHDP
jgi:hypothetical protein